MQSALEQLDRGTLALLAVAGDLAESTGAPTAEEARPAPRRAATRRTHPDRRRRCRRRCSAESGRYAPVGCRGRAAAGLAGVRSARARRPRRRRPPAVLEPVSEARRALHRRGAGDGRSERSPPVTETVLALRDAPARRLARGGLSLPDARRLAAAAAVDAAEVELLSTSPSVPDSRGASGSTWLPSTVSTPWLARPRRGPLGRPCPRLGEPPARRAARHPAQPSARGLGGDGLLDYLSWLYPAGGDWVRERRPPPRRRRDCSASRGPARRVPRARDSCSKMPRAAALAMAENFPAEVDRVYLQHDLLT